MQTIQSIIEHIIRVYDFELVSPGIPRNHFQYLKRNFLFIKKNVSEKLFYFLRDKISPIKFLTDRPDGEVWMRRRFSTEFGSLCELSIRSIPPEVAIYLIDDKGIYVPDYDNNFKITIWYPINYNKQTGESKLFPVNSKKFIECIDSHFSDLPILRGSLRDYKLNKILNG